MTIGDLAVPRQVKRAVAVLHDRYATYGAALDAAADGDRLAAAVRARLTTLSGADNVDAASLAHTWRTPLAVSGNSPATRCLRDAWPGRRLRAAR